MAQGPLASFHYPYGVAADAAGNVYVADSFNNQIRIISPTGSVLTMAGSGITGSVDGQGSLAYFADPRGVAVDSTGNVYVADYGNHKVRKVSPSGAVSTLVGSGLVGSQNGLGVSASFNLPFSVAVDSTGVVYVADLDNHKIRKISPSGMVVTLAGNGTRGTEDGQGTAATFNYPYGVAVDSSGNLHVADTENNKIRKIMATCPGGQYQSGSACLPCSAGSFSTVGSSSCLPCPTGTNSSPGATSCSSCAAG